MAVLPILRWPDPRLATPCATVADLDDSLRQLAGDMRDTMYAAPGRGLAAPQVGTLLRVFVMDITWKDGQANPLVIINPVVEWVSDSLATGTEGCLSIPGILAEVTRPKEILLRWTALDGSEWLRTFSGFAATCIQHELDHLDGLVTLDRVTPEVRQTLEAAYQR